MSDEFQLSSEESSAVIDATGKYRYLLRRRWDFTRRTVLFIMLNPSTADALQDDPTIRRCIAFAKGWNYGAIEVVNLFAWRATDPSELGLSKDPVGPENDKHILEAAQRARLIVAAWGSSAPHSKRAAAVLGMLAASRIFTWCLGVNKDGHPKHPLYLPADTVPTQYTPGVAA